MAIAVLSLTTNTGSSGNTTSTLSVSKPTGLADGAVLFAAFSGDTNITSPDNIDRRVKNTDGTWTRLITGNDAGPNVLLSIFYRVVTTAASEPSTYAFSFVAADDTTSSATPNGYAYIIRGLSGVDNATPIDVTGPALAKLPTAAGSTSGSSTPQAPATTFATANAWALAFSSMDNTANTWSAPSGYSNLLSVNSGRTIACASLALGNTPGSVAAASFNGGSSAPWVAWQVSVRPAGAAAAQQQLMLLGVGA